MRRRAWNALFFYILAPCDRLLNFICYPIKIKRHRLGSGKRWETFSRHWHREALRSNCDWCLKIVRAIVKCDPDHFEKYGKPKDGD